MHNRLPEKMVRPGFPDHIQVLPDKKENTRIEVLEYEPALLEQEVPRRPRWWLVTIAVAMVVIGLVILYFTLVSS